MRIFACLLLLAALGGIAVAQTDVTGKWSGSVNASTPEGDKQEPAILILKQNGSEITGTAGPNEGEQHAIKGKIEGNKIVLLVETDRGPIKSRGGG